MKTIIKISVNQEQFEDLRDVIEQFRKKHELGYSLETETQFNE